MESADAAQSEVSAVRALLVSDLVDSTAMLQRLGDREAARLMAAEDEVGRTLARRYNGQEIDKSDGFLFLFPEVWQAVGFAIEYHRKLAELSHTLTMPLRARIGIHCGEIILRPHSGEDVARGAKPMEVSGLAKPVAGRLMSAAQPGQTLLSEAAMRDGPGPCLRHLREELDLHGHAHGPYRLKGVSEPVRVFEVLAGMGARPREPLDNAKAHSVRRQNRRNLLRGAAAVAAIAALPAGYWSWQRFTRFEFPRASWMVLADWVNNVNDTALGGVLKTAFRIAMDQSRFAYVLNDGAVRETLVRMRRSETALIDREAAVEIARRERAAAVIIPAVDPIELGYRLSATVVDPWSDRVVETLVVAVASATHLTSALDELAAQVRKTLGESIQAIAEDSRPLAKVTTADMAALKLYSEADFKVRQRDAAGAVKLLEQAISIDPEFASAYAKLGTIQVISRYDPRLAEANWRRAIAIEERLTRREQMYIEAHLASMGTPEDMRSLWTAMFTVFPNDAGAGNNAALVDWMHYGRFEEARDRLLSVVEILHPWQYRAVHNLGYLRLAIGQMKESLADFEKSLHSHEDPVHFGLVRALIVERQFDRAAALLSQYAKAGEGAGMETERAEAGILLAVARDDLRNALALADELHRRGSELNFAFAIRVAVRARYLVGHELRDSALVESAFEELFELVQRDIADNVGGLMTVPHLDLLPLAIDAVRDKREDRMQRLQPMLELDGRWKQFPELQAAAVIIEGWKHLSRGEHELAIRASHDSMLRAPLFAASDLTASAQQAMGDTSALRVTLQSVHAQLHRALGESCNYFGTQLSNLLAWRRMQSLLPNQSAR
jgi:putative peptide modification system cyclase